MNSVTPTLLSWYPRLRLLLVAAVILLSACSEDSVDPIVDTNPTGDFELRSLQNDLVLIEGDESGLQVPLILSRQNGHVAPVELSLSGVSAADDAFISGTFTRLTLTPNADESQAILTLAIADLPLMPQQRQFIVTASDGQDRHDVVISVNVEPVDAPDIYLLIGQSNMVGFSGDGTRQGFPGGADETNPRIKQLNASKNDRQELFLEGDDFTSPALNIVEPAIVTAEDPLHLPLDPANDSGKDLEYIGLGLSFAKSALNNTSRNIVLVPAAWSGSAFCANDDGPNGQWNAQPTDNPDLGNTWLYDRAVTRANLAIQNTGGILRGILWHQGESDSNERCAPVYAENLERLVYQLRLNIMADRRGSGLRRPDANIPLVVGTMSRGSDERGDMTPFSDAKRQIDSAHHNLPSQVPSTAISIHDDLVPANGYPCGNTSCVHFGPGALREMGNRYYDALVRAAQP